MTDEQVNVQTEVNQVADILNFINTRPNTVDSIFRGHRDHEWKLNPKLARHTSITIRKREKIVMNEFKRLSLPFISIQPRNEFDWLTLAQHHGLPTRLLDWTYNPLTALWFVVRKGADNGNDGSVWMFSPLLEDWQVQQQDSHDNPYSVSEIMIYRPTYISQRIATQTSVFTIHPTGSDDEITPLERSYKHRNKLFKMMVPRARFKDIRKELNKYNINESTIFMDLDGICGYLGWRYLEIEPKVKG